MKIFLTGASGYVGARVYEYLKEQGHDLQGTYYGREAIFPDLLSLDIREAAAVQAAVLNYNPDVIVHAAAVAHGDSSQDEALLQAINVQGTENAVAAARAARCRFVFISSVAALYEMPYGVSKRKGEETVRESGLPYLVLRPSVVMGLSPNMDPGITSNKIVHAVLQRTPIEEDDVWKFQPTWLEHLCEIIQLWLEGKFEDGEPVYPLLPETKSRYEICRDVAARFGLPVTAVHKPRYSDNENIGPESLARNRLPQHAYREALEDFVEKLTTLAQGK